MFNNILVPLDGSSLSEKALPLALQIARRAGATIRLVSVLTPPDASIPPPHPGLPRDVQTALDLSAWRLRHAAAGDVQQPACGTNVLTSLMEGPVAPTLAEHAAGAGADLIVMTTHGRGPLSRFWLGSVTDELLRRSTVPLLVVRPADAEPADLTVELPIRRVVVPYDGSALAETALRPAITLARLFKAAVELVHVVSPPPSAAPDGQVYYQPATEAALLDAIIRQAHEMLDKTVARLAPDGLRVTTRVLIDQRIAAAVLEESRPGDVIALATHARGPATRWFLGSVADKLIRAAEVPVLVVRPKQ